MYSGIRLFKTAFMNTRRQILVSGIFLVVITFVLTVILSAVAAGSAAISARGALICTVIIRSFLYREAYLAGFVDADDLDSDLLTFLEVFVNIAYI